MVTTVDDRPHRSTPGQEIFRDSMGHLVSWAPMTLADGRAAFVTGGNDGTLRLWDPETGTQIAPPVAAGYAAHEGVMAVTGLRVRETPDGPRVAVTSEDGMHGRSPVRLWDPVAAELAGELPADESRPQRPSPADLPAGLPRGTTGEVHLLAVRRGVDGEPPAVLSAVHDTDGLQVWDPDTGTRTGTLELPGYVPWLTYVPRAGAPDLVAAYDWNGSTIRTWDAATGAVVAGPISAHAKGVHDVAVLRIADGRTVLASVGRVPSGPGTTRTIPDVVRLWDPQTGATVSTPLEYVATAVAALPNPGGDLLACLTDDGSVVVDAPVTGARFGTAFEPAETEHTHLIGIRGPAGRPLLVLVTESMGTADVFDVLSGEKVAVLEDSWIMQWAVLPKPDGTDALVVTNEIAEIIVWDPATGQRLFGPLHGHGPGDPADISIAVLHSDGEPSLVTGGNDCTLRRWRLPKDWHTGR